MILALPCGLLRLVWDALCNAVQDRRSVRGQRLPPGPPIRSIWLGHLRDIRREGFVAFGARCVAEYGPLVMLRFGPPVLGRRFLLVADPAAARQTLTQDLQRDYAFGTGPLLVFGRDAVFCTAAADPVHAERQRLIARHMAPDRLRRHAATMDAIWTRAVTDIVAGAATGCGVQRRGINQEVLSATQHVALRCWMGVDPTAADIAGTLRSYYETGSLLSAVLFDTWFFLGARRRVALLRHVYAPLLARALDACDDAADPQLRFVAESLDMLGWDRARLAHDPAYHARLLGSLAVYQHLFTVMLPSMGSTGGTILFLIRQLAAAPALQARLRAELAATDLLSELRPPPETAMAIRECLRLYPQAAGITRLLRQPRSYGGYFIPMGTYSFVHLHVLHRQVCAHAEPERFDPSRFSDPAGAANAGWAGFSLGPLACTGRSFAELQIAIALKAVLGRHVVSGDIPPCGGHNDYQGSVTLQPDPFDVTFQALPGAGSCQP